MTSAQAIQPARQPATDARLDPALNQWRGLLRLGGITALAAAAIMPVSVVVFMAWPPPDTAEKLYGVFQENWLIGLLNLDLLAIVSSVLLVPVTLALAAVLLQHDRTTVTVATAFALLGLVLFFVSREATLTLMALSEQHAAATGASQKETLVAVGQALLASYERGTTFQLSYLLGNLSGLALSWVMLRSRAFPPVVAVMGVLAYGLGFGLYLPGIGLAIALFSVLFLWLYYLLAGLRLLKLSSHA
jgi:hypothetical protein